MSEAYYNPYDFINPVRDPKFFAGRQKELEEIDYYLELTRSKRPTYNHLALLGERTSGKSSLLNIIAHKGEEKGFLTVKIPLNMETATNDVFFFKEFLDGIFTKGAEKGMYGGIRGKIYKTFRRLIDTLDLDLKVPIPLLFGTSYVGWRRKAKEASIPQHVVTHDLKELSNEAKEKGIPTIVLLFDECDLLAQNVTLLQKIRNVFMEVEGYLLVFSGTDQMFPMISDVFSPIPRFFKRINVKNFISLEETKECILKPLNEEEKKHVDLQGITEIHLLTGGSPYEINMIAHYMHRRYKQENVANIGLSVEVLDDVLEELERLRAGDHHKIANKIKKYGPENLKVLIALIEFPRVPQDWFGQYCLLRDLNSLRPRETTFKKSMLTSQIECLTEDKVIDKDEEDSLFFQGDQFDKLYLKYLAASRGIIDLRKFFVGLPDDPCMNLYIKLHQVLLTDFQKYKIHTQFDKRLAVSGSGEGKTFVIGFPSRIPRRVHSAVKSTVKSSRQNFFLGTPTSLRFRVNVPYMKEGFVNQIEFETQEDLQRFVEHFNLLKDKLELAGFKILLKDEIAWNSEGLELLLQKRWSEALEKFERALKINPLFEMSLVNKGEVLIELKEYDRALECFDEALKLQPNHPRAWYAKGRSLIHLGQNKEGLECLNKAIELDPEDWDIFADTLRALFIQGEHDLVLGFFDEALKLQPNLPRAWHEKGRGLIHLGQNKEGLECLNKTIELDPENWDVFIDKAMALYKLGEHDRALECFDEALKLQPNHPRAWHEKGVILVLQDRNEEALECLNKAIELNLEDWSVFANKGLVLSHLERYGDTIEAFDKSLKLKPDNADVLNEKGRSLIFLERFQEALEAFDAALEVDPKNMDSWILKGRTFSKLGNYEVAIDCCNKAIEIDPKDGFAWYNKACYEAKLGNVDRALASLKQAIMIDGVFFDGAKKDKDFDEIRNDERFVAFFDRKKSGKSRSTP